MKYMNSGININELKSDILDFNNVQNHNFAISYMDFTSNVSTSIQNSLYPTAISSAIYNKCIRLKNIDFINSFSVDILIENIEKDFLIEAQKMGYKNRKTLNKETEFDIVLKNKNNSKDFIINKLYLLQYHFHKKTTLGGYNFLASNFLTYINLRNYFDETIKCGTVKDKYTLNGVPYIINNCLDEDVILVGRKNNMEQPGIHCFILTDKEKNLDIDMVEISSFDTYKTNKMYRLYYKIDDIGLTPENQYLIIKTSDLQSNRYKKLNRIKELYNK